MLTFSNLTQRRDCVGSLARFWQKSYASDYLTLITILVLQILMHMFIKPFHRLFTLDDHRIQYPYAEHERVPPAWLFAYSTGVPLLVVTVWAIIFRPGAHKVHVTYLGLILSVLLTGLVTDIIKDTVGRPRPDLIARCTPKSRTPKNKLVDLSVCTQKNERLLNNGFKSFPSGHSSFAFSGLGYIALLLSSQTHALNPHTPLPLTLLPLISLLAALLIAISRTEDYRHDVWDVTAGSALGLLIALGSYRRYYPGLRTKRCETPHPNRAEMGANGKVKEEMKDEEMALRGRESGLDDEDDEDSPGGSRESAGSGGSGRERRVGRSR